MSTDELAADREAPRPEGSAAEAGRAGGQDPGGQAVPLAAQQMRLVEACLASAPGAWDEFVGRFAGLLGHVVARTAAQRGVPLPSGARDDLVAEVLVEILRNDAAALRAFAGRASLPTYLTVIARRVAVRALDRHRPQAAAVSPLPIEPTDRHDDVATLSDREAVEALLGTLDATEAAIVRMHHLEARSYGEISRLTGLPLGSIGPALSKARQKLRERGQVGVS